VAFFATFRTELTRGERAFTGRMAPPGIVAAATASTFGPTLAAQHVGGASKVLPVASLVIVFTVALYGLTAVPVAHRLGVTRPSRRRPLLIGGDPSVTDLARALLAAGLDVLMWAPSDGLRAHIKQAGLELAPRRATRSSRRPGRRIRRRHRRPPAHPRRRLQHPGRHDLAGNSAAPVYRLPPNQPAVVASYVPGEALFAPTLTHSVLTAHHTAGANITTPGLRWWDPAGYGPLVLGQPQRHPAPRNTLPPPRPPSRATPLPSCARPKADSRSNGELFA
jgi:hypothetical protein